MSNVVDLRTNIPPRQADPVMEAMRSTGESGALFVEFVRARQKMAECFTRWIYSNPDWVMHMDEKDTTTALINKISDFYFELKDGRL